MARLMIVIMGSMLMTHGLVADDAPVAADQVVQLWPGSPPKWSAPDEPERDTSGSDGRDVAGKRVIRLGFVSKPELHVYRPKSRVSETAIVICPGGGYSILAWDLEGTEIAQWLQGIGVTAVVLKYRVPTRNDETRWLAPVQDVQRSISVVRNGAIPGVSAKRIGVLGFSAGGNAAARAALSQQRHYEPIDKHDRASAKPDFAVLIYPAWLAEKENPKELIEDLHVSKDSPPMFLAHAMDDRVDCMSSVTMFSELKRHGVTASLHVFASGGHGYEPSRGQADRRVAGTLHVVDQKPRMVIVVMLAESETSEIEPSGATTTAPPRAEGHPPLQIDQEWANALTHAIGAVGTVVVGSYMIMAALSKDVGLAIACSAYIASVFGTFLFSTLSHVVRRQPLLNTMRAWDQAMIYAMISGTYTPIIYRFATESTQIPLLVAIWSVTAWGFLVKVVFRHRINSIGTYSYLLLGWLPAIPLVGQVPSTVVWAMVAGGALYTIGVVFLVNDAKFKYLHAAWHICVITAALCHYLGILHYIVQA